MHWHRLAYYLRERGVYQAFPSPAPTERPPESVQRAVHLMYAGAVVYVISGIAGLVALVTAAPGGPFDLHVGLHALPGPAMDRAARAILSVGAVLSIVVPIVLWLWMAWKCAAGRAWARVLSTVFFGLATVATLTVAPTGAWGLFGAILSWFIGLGAVILLWQHSSSSYFHAPSPGASSFLRNR